jgi:PAS domain S-box-containing protein
MALEIDSMLPDRQATFQTWHRLTDDLPVAVIITNARGLVTSWSPEAERLYQWRACEAVGAPILDLTVGPSSTELAHTIMATVSRGEPWEGELTATRRDGTTVRVHVIDLPVIDSNGHIAAIVGLSFDGSYSPSELCDQLDRIADTATWVARARTNERERLGRDLHDELGQLLTVLRTELLRYTGVRAETQATGLHPLLDIVDLCLNEVRRICHDLRHEILDLAGLFVRIERATAALGQRSDIRVDFTADPALISPECPVVAWPTVLDAAWHITQEALTNVERHARASHVSVRLGLDGDHLVGTVIDSGVGIDPTTRDAHPGLGLVTMRERAGAVGGSLHVGQAGSGTVVEFRLPLATRP